MICTFICSAKSPEPGIPHFTRLLPARAFAVRPRCCVCRVPCVERRRTAPTHRIGSLRARGGHLCVGVAKEVHTGVAKQRRNAHANEDGVLRRADALHEGAALHYFRKGSDVSEGQVFGGRKPTLEDKCVSNLFSR